MAAMAQARRGFLLVAAGALALRGKLPLLAEGAMAVRVLPRLFLADLLLTQAVAVVAVILLGSQPERVEQVVEQTGHLLESFQPQQSQILAAVAVVLVKRLALQSLAQRAAQAAPASS